MSVARGFGLNGKSIGWNVTYPSVVSCNFIVDSTNGNGLGIRSLKSNGYIRNVFMHTSATPGANDNYTNPNPASGYVLVQFKQNFNYYLGGFNGQVSPPTGSVTSTTAGNAYIIKTLGTTTLAQWQTAGLPVGLTPTVNQSFIATATGAVGGTGTMYTPSVSGITVLEAVGDPNQSIANSSISSNGGAWVLLQCLTPITTIAVTAGTAGNAVTLNGGTTLEATGGGTVTGTTTMTLTAPANNSVMGMTFIFDRGSTQIPDSAGSTGI